MLCSEIESMARDIAGDKAGAGQRWTPTQWAGAISAAVIQIGRDCPALFIDSHGIPQIPTSLILASTDTAPVPAGYESVAAFWSAGLFFMSDSHDKRDQGNVDRCFARYDAAMGTPAGGR